MESRQDVLSDQSFAAKKKKGPPQVRQTLTSKYRMLKANPLLMHELGKKLVSNIENKEESFLITPLKTLVAVMDENSERQQLSDISVRSVSNVHREKTVSKQSSNKELPKHGNVKQHNVKQAIDQKKTQVKERTTQKLHPVKNFTVANGYNTNVQKKLVQTRFKSNTTIKAQTTSGMIKNCDRKQSFVMPKNYITVTQNGNMVREHNQPYNTIMESNSTQIVSEAKANFVQESDQTEITDKNSITIYPLRPHAMNEPFHTPNIKRPSSSNSFSARRSTIVLTPNNKQKSVFVSKSSSIDMAKKLSEWLKHKGKHLGHYQHLKCFGVDEQPVNLNSTDIQKENIGLNIITLNNFDLKRESNKINEPEVITEDNDFKNENMQAVEEIYFTPIAKEALVDLHKLILEGYPPEQCEIWLRLIKQKHRQVEEEPQYWECRAALEQTKGNINLAVECYKAAIIQGAEVQKVDNCLDQLLQKFSLLDINSESNPHMNNERSKIVKDARNIFKSSIIQFAVREKTFKKKLKEEVTFERKFVATPVRRSTRLSRSAFISTPGVHIYSSLQEVDVSIKDNMDFQCNYALKD